MADIVFNGPAGRLEGHYQSGRGGIALIMHPHPHLGGTMNAPMVQGLFQIFARLGFNVLRFNFRGVGRSEGSFDNGIGELADAAVALDWLQQRNPDASSCWIVGYSFGAWIGMQLLMRRPEATCFISVSPPANLYDFSFLAPCPAPGLIVHGGSDRVAPSRDVRVLVRRLKDQQGLRISHREIAGANHLFAGKMEVLTKAVEDYVKDQEGVERSSRRSEARGRRL